MKKVASVLSIIVLVLCGGCTKENPSQPHANVPPKTFLWLYPDSTIFEGQSRQHVRWWGEDPDGIVKGFVFTSGKFSARQVPNPVLDTIACRWKVGNDSILAFPLLTKRDTFDVLVRAVDNTFSINLPDQALIRFYPTSGAIASHLPFWDKNENGIFDSTDIILPGLIGAMDPKGASLGLPLLNQPPSVVFTQNPNDPSVLLQQPPMTFTAATFAWIGTDPDGDQTIQTYDIALNDTTNAANFLTIPSSVTLVSLVVPRSRSDVVPPSSVQAVMADVWSGTFAPGLSYSSSRRLLGTLPNLKVDTLNTFFVRARDIAGDVSKFIAMPGDSLHSWFVRKPVGRLLIIDDYINSDSTSVLQFYHAAFNKLNNPDFTDAQVLNIATGLTPQQKSNSKFGKLVPPYTDPALIYTMQLYDLILWYTDQIPSLAVAQSPLYYYINDPTHHGKVIFTTSFQNSTDPRGALRDFAPLDSISNVVLSNSRLVPTPGETKIPNGYVLLPDSSDPSDIAPPLVFGNVPSSYDNITNLPIYSIFMRPIYRRADAKYLYHMQKDGRIPVRYTYVTTLNDLTSNASSGSTILVCGRNGTLLYSADGGITWSTQVSAQQYAFEKIHLINSSSAIAVGDTGTIYFSGDAGVTWSDHSQITEENFYDAYFFNASAGYVVGSSGVLIHTTNGGASWAQDTTITSNAIRSISFIDDLNGLAVGDNGFVIKTTDGGKHWATKLSLTPARLYGVSFVTPSLVLACGSRYTIIRSTNGGESWSQVNGAGNADSIFKSIIFTDPSNGFACGTNGSVSSTADGGATWVRHLSLMTQTLNGMSFSSSQTGWFTGTGGVIIRTDDAGQTWRFQPEGNLNVGLIDGPGSDGTRSFLFLGLPLHNLDGPGDPNGTVVTFLQHIVHNEFGF